MPPVRAYACRFRQYAESVAVSAVSAGKSKQWSAKFDAETHLGLVRRARRMNRTLAQAFPHVYCELDFTNPLELTVATILSAQSTDKGVNLTTPALFAKYRTALDYAKADRDRAGGHGPAHRLLPEQGQFADAAGAGTRRAIRRPGARTRSTSW